MLKIGDKLYIRPDKVERINFTDPSSFFHKINMTKDEILNHEFIVIDTRVPDKFGYQKTSDICVMWLDGMRWWWGQVGYSEPWTYLFIDEKTYLRNKKLSHLVKD